MATVPRTNLRTILPLLMTRLQAVTGLTESACFMSQRQEMPFDGLGDQYIWVRTENATINEPIYLGGGRIDTRHEQVLSVTVRTRLALDVVQGDLIWLTHDELGHLERVDQVCNALTGFHVTDANNNLLCTHPVVPHQWRGPLKDRKVPAEWGESVKYFQFVYEQDLDQTYS